jgi:hypothetical protein
MIRKVQASLVLGLLSSVVVGFNVIFPPELEGFYNSPFLPSYKVNISLAKPIVARLAGSFAETGPYENTILLGCIEDETGTMEDIIRRGIKNYPGIIGWMSCSVFTDSPGLIEYIFDGTDRSDITIPVWDAGLKNISRIRDFMRSDAPNRTVIIEIDFDDVNEWAVVNNSGAKEAYSVILGGYALGVAIFALIKLISFIRQQKPQRNLPQIILWIELFSNLERAVWAAIDPILSRYIFPYFAANLLPTISIPAYAMTSLLITLYWKEVVANKQMRALTFLDKMQVPFYAIVSVIWAIEIINAFFRSFGIGPFFILLIILSVFYLITSVLTASFFLYYGRNLLKTLKDPSLTKTQAKSSSKFRAIRTLIAGAVLELGYCIVLISPATVQLMYFTPWGFFVVNFMAFLLLISISLVKILAFVAPSKAKHPSVENGATAMTPRTANSNAISSHD